MFVTAHDDQVRNLNHRRCVPDKRFIRDRLYSVPRRLADLAAATPTIDLSMPALPAPFGVTQNQGAEGACGPFTACEIISLSAERNEGRTLTQRPAPRWIYYTTRFLQGTLTQDSGVDNNSLLKALETYGWCDENLCPYSDDVARIADKPSKAASDQAATRKITQAHVVHQTQADMTGALAANDAQIFSFTVPSMFMSAGVAKNGIMPTIGKTAQSVGGHDVSLVGITTVDAPGVLPGNHWPANHIKIKNHWLNADGSPWGDGGFGYIPLAFVLNPQWSGDGGFFWTIDQSGLPVVGPPTPPPVVPPVVPPSVYTMPIPGYMITATPKP